MTCSQHLDTIEAGLLTPETSAYNIFSYQKERVCMLYNFDYPDINYSFWAESDPWGPQNVAIVSYGLSPRAQVTPEAFALRKLFYLPI